MTTKGLTGILPEAGGIITGKTGLYALLGHPAAHSVSPMIHNTAFRELGLDHVYLAFDVEEKDLKTAVFGLAALGARGFNVTMPHKRAVCDLCDELSEAARLCRSVNTVIIENGRLIGHTSDGIGYIRAAEDALGFTLRGKRMTLIGAGGAAMSIIAQGALEGLSEIHVFNRRSDSFTRMQTWLPRVNSLSDCHVGLHDLADTDALRTYIAQSDLLTNATSVGMAPDTEASPIPDPSFLHEGLAVSDIIYHPRETALMAMARSRGLVTFNGLYMLLYQGAESFRLWTGMDMPVESIKKQYERWTE